MAWCGERRRRVWARAWAGAAGLQSTWFSPSVSAIPNRSREFRPIAFESEYFFGGGQRRLRLNPADWLRAVVGKTVDAADACPNHVAGAEIVAPAVGDRVNTSAHDKVRLFEGMIVRIDFRAR